MLESFGVPYLSLASFETMGLAMVAPPRVAYKGPPSASTAWVLGVPSNGSAFTTRAKSTATNVSWTNQILHSVPGYAEASTPLIGAGGGAVELVVTGR